MTDKELKRLSRIELLEIIRVLQNKNSQLSEENRTLREELQGRRDLLEQSPSFCDISRELDKATASLQSVAQQYQLLLESESSRLVALLTEQDCKAPPADE